LFSINFYLKESGDSTEVCGDGVGTGRSVTGTGLGGEKHYNMGTLQYD